MAWAVLLAGLPADTLAQDDGARVYWPAPVRTQALSTNLSFVAGNTSAFNPTLPFESLAFSSRVFKMNYDLFTGFFGRTNHLHFTLAAGALEATTTGLSPTNYAVTAKGRADPTAFWRINLFGAPAMTPAEFATYRLRTLIDFQLFVTTPLGEYDRDQLLNIGTNRWMFRLGFPLTQAFGEWTAGRRTTFTLVPSIGFFTSSDKNPSGTLLEQAPLLRLEGHVTRDIGPGVFLSVDVLFQSGGETTVDGVRQDNGQSSLALGLSMGFEVTSEFKMDATWMNTYTESERGANTNVVRVRFLYLWNSLARAEQAAEENE